MHIICTICNDAVNQAECLDFTTCGHLFHHHCLAQWLERSRTCPQCRSPQQAARVRRLFPTVGEAPSGDDAAALQAQLDDARLAVRQAEAHARAQQAAAADAAQRLAAAQEELKGAQARQRRSEAVGGALREQLQHARAHSRDAARLQADLTLAAAKLATLQALQKVVEASAEEVEEMLEGYSDARTLAVFATAFKRAVGVAEKARRGAEGRLATARASLAVERARNAFLTSELNKLKELAATEPRRVLKRKSSDSASCLSATRRRVEPGADLTETAAEAAATTVPAAVDSDVSLGSLVARIEAADSPYLRLRHAPPALALQPIVEVRAQQASTSACNAENRPGAANKPAPAPAAHKPAPAAHKYSIFAHRPAPSALQYLSSRAAASPDADAAYDGLGGRARPDAFPQPKRSYAPKRTARHRLSRKPTAQDIGAMIERINSKKK